MGEHAGESPRKFISFHCLENESNELKDSNTEGTENFPELPQRSESDVECSGGGGESPEKTLVDLEVMPVCEVRNECTEVVVVPNLTNVVQSFQEDRRDDSHMVVIPLIAERLEVVDYSQLQQLIKNSPREFGSVLESTTDSTRTRLQIELLLIFLKIGGHFWAPDDYWTPVGVLTGHSAATVQFNWSPSHISLV